MCLHTSVPSSSLLSSQAYPSKSSVICKGLAGARTAPETSKTSLITYVSLFSRYYTFTARYAYYYYYYFFVLSQVRTLLLLPMGCKTTSECNELQQ